MAAPTIEKTMERLHRAGLRMTLGAEKTLVATPASALNADLRALIVAHKWDIVNYLKNAEIDPTTSPGNVQGKFKAASLALDTAIAAAGLMANPDRWCYPTSDAMTALEIDRFMARVALFGRQGLALAQAQALADRLALRDRKRHALEAPGQAPQAGEQTPGAHGTPTF